MTFWRNESTSELVGDGSSGDRLREVQAELREGPHASTADALDVVLQLLPLAFGGDESRDKGHLLTVQELSCLGGTLSVNFAAQGTQQKVVGAIVAGGIGIWLDCNGHFEAELSVYLHRLVCTNGMIRKIGAEGRVTGASLGDWSGQMEVVIPKVIEGIPIGFEKLGRSYDVRLGILRPAIPVILDVLKVAEPSRGLILNAFEAEPGDTLGHFVNALSRAANLLMLDNRVPPAEAFRKRRQLQSASMELCDNFLERFVQGHSMFDIAKDMRHLFA